MSDQNTMQRSDAGMLSGNEMSYAMKGDSTMLDYVPGAPSITHVYEHLADRPDVDHSGFIDDGLTTTDNNPSLVGMTEAYAWVTVYDGTTLLGKVQADKSGNWMYTVTSALQDGTHHFTAVSDAGLTSGAYTVDIASLPPIIIYAQDDIGTALHEGAVTDDGEPRFSGAGKPNSQITFFEDGHQVGVVQTDNWGHWGVDLDLGNGTHTLVAVDDGGRQSPPFTLNVNGAATVVPQPEPEPLVITGVHDNVGASQGDLANGATTDDTRPTMEGTAPANARVSIYDGGKFLATVTVDNDGRWSYTPTKPLSEGTHVLYATLDNGQPEVAFTVVIDTQQPAPAITAIYDDASHSYLSDGATTADTRPTLSGTGTPNSMVTVFDGARSIGTAQVDDKGHWEMTPKLPLRDGFHDLIVVSDNGTHGNDIVIVVDTKSPPPQPEPEPLVITGVHDNVGASQGDLANGATTDDTRPTMEGTAPANATVSIYDGAKFLASVPVDSDGHWSYTPTKPLSEGKHVLHATLDNGQPEVTFTVVIDTQQPAPAITAVYDDVYHSYLSNGAATTDTRPTLSGTGTANSTVTVFDGARSIGTAQVDDKGHWEMTPKLPLRDGFHDLTVVSDNGTHGNDIVIVVETLHTAPVEVPTIIESMYDGAGNLQGYHMSGDTTTDTRPTLHGMAAADSVVTLSDGNHVIGTTMTDSVGNWSFTPDSPLGNGVHSLTAATEYGAATPPFIVTVETDDVSSSHVKSLALGDVLHGSEAELFTAPPSHDDARLNLHDVNVDATAVDQAITQGTHSATHDMVPGNANLVLPHEQAHAQVM